MVCFIDKACGFVARYFVAYYFIVCCLVFCASIDASISYDHVALLAQKDKWEEANKEMQELVVKNHDSPSILYDAGVVSYKVKQYEAAVAYFEDAAQHKKVKKEVKERALFNAGNAHAALHNYQKALEFYEAVLKENAGNEHARYNAEIVKKKLKKEEQEENKQPEDNKSGNQEQDQQSAENKEAGDSKNGKSGSSSDGSDDGGESSKGSDKGDCDKDGQAHKQAKNTHNGEHDAAGDKDAENYEQKENGANHEQVPENSLDKKHKQQGKEQENKEQEALKNKQANKQESVQQSSDKIEKDTQETVQDIWVARMLSERDSADACGSKQLMKAIVDKQVAGQRGTKKCW